MAQPRLGLDTPASSSSVARTTRPCSASSYALASSRLRPAPPFALAGYASYLRNHFVPYFGQLQLGKISPSAIQGWVSLALDPGLSPRSIAKYHTMLHSIFARAVRDRLIGFNPCADTELPKVITRRARTLTPAEFDAILVEIPERFRPLVLTVHQRQRPSRSEDRKGL